MCEDWGVDPEDVVLLAVAYELKSPRMGQWTRKEWVEGWKNVGYVSTNFEFYCAVDWWTVLLDAIPPSRSERPYQNYGIAYAPIQPILKKSITTPLRFR